MIATMNAGEAITTNGNVLRMNKCATWLMMPHMITEAGKSSNKRNPM
jgi:hypothetical protein